MQKKPKIARLTGMEYALRNPRDPYSYMYIDLVFCAESGEKYKYHIPDREETLYRRLSEFWGAYGLRHTPEYGGIWDAAAAPLTIGDLHIADRPVLIRVGKYGRITSLRPVPGAAPEMEV